MLYERNGRGRDANGLDATADRAQPAEASSLPVDRARAQCLGTQCLGTQCFRTDGLGTEGLARSPTVMIVDDDDAIREALEDVLSDEGYRVIGMADGQQALDHLNAESRPDAILLDLWMPVMDGWKFLDALLEDTRFSGIPLVVLTAARDQRARELRVAEVLTKPVQLQQVLAALERLTRVS